MRPGFAVLIRSAHGIDTHAPDAVRFTIDDGLLPPYIRDLRSDTIRTVKLDEDPMNRLLFCGRFMIVFWRRISRWPTL